MVGALRIPAKPDGMTTCIMIREVWTNSRLFGEEERKVIDKWNKKIQGEGEGLRFDRAEENERAKAAEIDRAKQKSGEAPEGSNTHINDQGNVTVDQNANKSADTIGPESFKILPGDVLHITIDGYPGSIDGDFKVDASGMLDLSTAKIERMTEGSEWVNKHLKNLEPMSVQGLNLDQATEGSFKHVGRIFSIQNVVLTFDRKTLERRMKSIRQTSSI